MVELPTQDDLEASANFDPIPIPPAIGSVDYLNMVLATNFELGQKASLGIGLGLPLRSNSGFFALQSGPADRTFNWSLGLNFNDCFGQLYNSEHSGTEGISFGVVENFLLLMALFSGVRILFLIVSRIDAML